MESLREHVSGFLHKHGIRLNTDLGQHFLVDEEVLEDIVDAADIQLTDHVVEIGAGIGVLTLELLARAERVTTIELDDRMLPLLKDYTAHLVRNEQHLQVIHGNALQIPFPTDRYKIVANIPYHITSPLFRHVFWESPKAPETMTLLMQREVAQNITDTENAGMLTIIVSLFGKARLIRTVQPGSFLPPPKVDSAVLHVDCYPEPKADRATMEEVFRLTKIGFGQKRKMLRNTFGSLPGGLDLLEQAKIDPTRRPQTLSTDEWIGLARVSSAKR